MKSMQKLFCHSSLQFFIVLTTVRLEINFTPFGDNIWNTNIVKYINIRNIIVKYIFVKYFLYWNNFVLKCDFYECEQKIISKCDKLTEIVMEIRTLFCKFIFLMFINQSSGELNEIFLEKFSREDKLINQ